MKNIDQQFTDQYFETRVGNLFNKLLPKNISILIMQVDNLKASIVELKLTEVDNEFSNYPAALSMELRTLNNKLAHTEEENR